MPTPTWTPTTSTAKAAPSESLLLGHALQDAYLQGLEGNPNTLAPVVEGRTATVARVDGCIYLDPQELCCPMHIAGDLYSRDYAACH